MKDKSNTDRPEASFIGGEGEGVTNESTPLGGPHGGEPIPYDGDFDNLTSAEILELIDRDCDEEEDGPSYYSPEDLDRSPMLRGMFLNMLKKEWGLPIDDEEDEGGE